MLEVLPIQTKTEQESLCVRAGIHFKVDAMAYRATVDGELTAVCQFSMDAEGGHIHDLAMVKDREFSDRDRIESLFVMGRAAMNFIDLCGVHTAFFDAPCENETLIKAIGFRKNQEGRYEMDLTDFFIEPCQHHKSQE